MKKEPLQAYCTNIKKCNRESLTGSTASGVIKLVGNGTTFCPDCGHVLVWRKGKTKLTIAEKAKKRPKPDYDFPY